MRRVLLNEAKMIEKKYLMAASFVLVLGIAIVFFANSLNVSAVGEAVSCCERTVSGAFCQNSPPAECDNSYRTAPTSCESTSYCKQGTCFDSQEGTCLEGTPQLVCQENGGVWDGRDADELPQCQLGCCFIGDGAAFVTQTRCKKLASDFGLETNFRPDINSEAQCIASAFPQEKGACVFEQEFQRTCKFLTRKECSDLEATSPEGNVEFHQGFLCSAETLATNCGPTEKTTCSEIGDVYFIDSCGNLANIYDARRIKDKEYWSEINEKNETCSPNENNANSATCGNCNYLLGSTCKEYERGNPQTSVRPQFGDFICADLSCRYQGQRVKHGETFCADSPGTEKNSPGSEYYRGVCYNSEIIIEPCASFRQEVCIEDEINGFSVAACRVNRWQDCVAQDNKEDCENTDRRDCVWNEDVESLLSDENGLLLVVDEEGKLVSVGDDNEERDEGASCLPLNAPGLEFWESGRGEEACAIADGNCIVKYKKNLFTTGWAWNCVENCECISDDWENSRNKMCLALGDCGKDTNYIGMEGFDSGSAVTTTPLGENNS